MEFDVDDVGALCLAHALQDRGEVELLAVVHNVGYPAAIGAVSVINHFYGRDEVALGAFKGEFAWAPPYTDYVDDLVANWPSPVQHSGQVEEAVVVLRRVLAAAEPHSVTIASVGFLTNLAGLLASPPDEMSDLGGAELALVAVMGGTYPSSGPFSTFNFNCGGGLMGEPLECFGSAKAALALIPSQVKVIFSGFEVGIVVHSGAALTYCTGEENPCRQAYVDYLGEGVDRPSWDPLTVLAAVRGAGAVGCRKEGKGGGNVVAEWGGNLWEEGRAANQTYLVLERPPREVGELIDGLLCGQQD
jgi:hypothetical protein